MAGDGDVLALGDGELVGGGTLEVDLGAVDVELGLDDPAPVVVGGDVVHGDHFSAKQVGACGHSRGKADAKEIIGIVDLGDCPFLGRLVIAVVPDLEPTGATGVLVEVGDGLGIDGYGTLVRAVDEAGLLAVGVGAHFEGYLGAGGGGNGVVDLLEAVSACLGVSV